jgi:hypothetical protein
MITLPQPPFSQSAPSQRMVRVKLRASQIARAGLFAGNPAQRFPKIVMDVGDRIVQLECALENLARFRVSILLEERYTKQAQRFRIVGRSAQDLAECRLGFRRATGVQFAQARID